MSTKTNPLGTAALTGPSCHQTNSANTVKQ